MTETTATATTTYRLNAWTPSNGQTRYYLNDWQESLLGLDIEYRKSGSILFAELNGEKISNTEAARMSSAKLWMDEAGEWHLDRWAGRDMTAAQVLELVTAKLATATIIK